MYERGEGIRRERWCCASKSNYTSKCVSDTCMISALVSSGNLHKTCSIVQQQLLSKNHDCVILCLFQSFGFRVTDKTCTVVCVT